MCRSVAVSNIRAIQNFPSAWASFVPKLTTMFTVTETKILGVTHVAFISHLLTNPLEHGDAIVQHDSGLQILADVYVTLLECNSDKSTCNPTEREKEKETETEGRYETRDETRDEMRNETRDLM